MIQSASPAPDPARERLYALRETALDGKHAGGARWDVRLSRLWDWIVLAGVIGGGLVATVSAAIASQTADVAWSRAAAIAGAVVTACGAIVLKLKPVEKLHYAHQRLADYEDVARRAENGLALGGGADLVDELTKDLWEISRRELPD